MIVKYLDVNGRKYKLQHPGARSYVNKSKELREVNIDGYVQMNNEKLFDYAFGKSAKDYRLVFTDDNAWVNWENASVESSDHTPTISELEEVWSPVLARFLAGDFIESEERPPRWKWVPADTPRNTSKNTRNTTG
jgi:hypothetical protein